MSAGSVEFIAFMAAVCFIAWLISKGHRHKWKETSRQEVVRTRDKVLIGFRSYCVCEECGEPRSFNLE
jgi:hypothetical protein